HTQDDIEYLENLKLEPISSVLAKNENIHDYLNMLFKENEILEERYIKYECDCSRERFMGSLLALPKKDLEELAQEESIDIRCEFCNKEYRFDRKDIELIMTYADRKKED
ncbi:MAG: Hsp33 family molecular chaperone HslO, partial [Erysipelotrichaceae bacterium]|nr:Hsp33 family molecular chaperone HslO [Erysipelotrichaceae bacterium]